VKTDRWQQWRQLKDISRTQIIVITMIIVIAPIIFRQIQVTLIWP